MSTLLRRMSSLRLPPLSGSPASVDQARRRWVATLVRRHGVPEADVDDVTQNVMIAIHRAAPIAVPEGRSPEEAWEAWCRGVVRRQVASHRRELWQSLPGQVDPTVSVEPDPSASFELGHRPRAYLPVGQDSPLPFELDPSMPAPQSPEDLLITAHETARARLALEELRAKKADRHAVLVAYEIDERSISEIAASLGITVNTCWNRLRLAREDLRAVWKRLRARRPAIAPARPSPRRGDGSPTGSQPQIRGAGSPPRPSPAR